MAQSDDGLDDRGSIPGRRKVFFFKPLRPDQPPTQWVPGVLSQRGKARPGRDADHSAPSRAEVKSE
jgi:hypothetical protein